ncbi:MAG: TetR/AcrR family transcriptional regulator C-terminal domain-containing protein [Mogibacterium sp.]|nr:TetR/AcrR family transcriptional regulator C-terminal domain-containing protein [Mogibacterium sp.]
MKRRTAKEILADSFRELTKRKSAGRITVIDIAENCGYSTTTFYRHFKDKYDLMAWEYTCRVEMIMDEYAGDESEWFRVCLNTAKFFDEEKDYLKNLLLHTNGYDSFVFNMKKIHFDIVSRWIMKTHKEEVLDTKTEMYIRAYCHGTVDLSCEWIMGKYDVTVEELAEVFVNCMPDPLRKYLIP